MQLIAMPASEVSLLAAAYPTRSEWARIVYDGVNLVVPDDLVANVQAIDLTAAAKAQLLAYAKSKRQTIADGGISVNIGSTGSPQMVEASTDTDGRALLNTAVGVAAANPSATTPWVPDDGMPVTLTAAQVLTIGPAVNTFIQSTFATLAAVITAINAGTVTTTAEVDAFASPSWPANS